MHVFVLGPVCESLLTANGPCLAWVTTRHSENKFANTAPHSANARPTFGKHIEATVANGRATVGKREGHGHEQDSNNWQMSAFEYIYIYFLAA